MSSLSAFAFHSPADLAREASDHDAFARSDYYSEAYGAEARMLGQQDFDDREFWAMEDAKEEAAGRGIAVEALLDERRRAEAARIEAEKCKSCMTRILNHFLPF